MTIITIGDDRYLVVRELGTDSDAANNVRNAIGGLLIKDRNSGRFLICTKIEDIEYEGLG